MGDPYLDSLSFSALLVGGKRQSPILMETEPLQAAQLQHGRFGSQAKSRWERSAIVRVGFDYGNESLFEEFVRMTEARAAFLREAVSNGKNAEGFF